MRGPRFLYVVEYRGTAADGHTCNGWRVAKNRAEAVSGRAISDLRAAYTKKLSFEVRKYAAGELTVLR